MLYPNSKSIFASKTVWFAVLKIIGAGVLYFYGVSHSDSTAQKVAAGIFITAVADFGLRVSTTQPVL